MPETPSPPPGFKLDAQGPPRPPEGFVVDTAPPPRTLPYGFFSKQNKNHNPVETSLPEDTPRRMLDAGLSALPYVGAGMAAAATGGAALPAIAAAALGGAGGSIAEQGLRKATNQNPPKSFDETASRVLGSTVENTLAEVGGAAINKPLEKVFGEFLNPERLYQQALKPVGKQSKVIKAVKGGLDEGIVLNSNAKLNAENVEKSIRQEVDDMITSKPRTIRVSEWQPRVQGKFDKLRSKWGRVAGKGQDYIRQIDEMERSFYLQEGKARPYSRVVTTQQPVVGANGKPMVSASGQPLTRNVAKTVTVSPEEMPLWKLRMRVSPLSSGDAQTIKRSTYMDTSASRKTAFDPNVDLKLQTTMQKNLAQAAKESLEIKYPGLKEVNARDGAMIDLIEQLDKFAAKEIQSPKRHGWMVGIGTGVGAGLGSARGVMGSLEGAGAGAAAGEMASRFMDKVLADPAIKSKVAILIRRAQGKAGAIPPGARKMIIKTARQVPPNAIRLGEHANAPSAPPGADK